MSVLRPLLSRRVGLALVAAALLLIGTLVAAPSVSGAPPARVKQFTASISPATATAGVPVPSPGVKVTVTNCGGQATPDPRCTLASTIGLGSIRILVPTEFRPIGTPVPSSPNWTASYNPSTGNITANVTAGSNKLQPGQTVDITFASTPTTCPTAGDKEFTTAAWGSTTISGSDPFAIQGGQPVIALAANESCLESGDEITDPDTQQTETISGFQGHVFVTFGGNLSCSFDPTFGTQWMQYRLPTQVNITPGDDFVAGTPKISTSTFPATGVDSSLYLICYGVPKADHPTPFKTRGGGDAETKTVDGVESWVGILPNCYNPLTGQTRPEPCVSEQFLNMTTNRIVISIRIPPGDPYKR